MNLLMIPFGIAMIVMIALYKLLKVKGALHRMFIFLAGFFLVLILAVLFRKIDLLMINLVLAAAIYVDFKRQETNSISAL